MPDEAQNGQALKVCRNGDWRSHIVSGHDVCGNNARIKGTRLSVWVLENASRLGYSDADLLEQYPFIGQAELDAARQYALVHRDQIDELIRRNTEG